MKFPSLESGIDLLKSIKLSPSFGSGSPSEAVQSLIHNINTADPNFGFDEDEDELGSNWGHAQFSGQWRDALTKWDDVGSPQVACQLVAATIKTTLVARVLCRKEEAERKRNQLPPLTYLSDTYLDLLTMQLWSLWKNANGVSHLFN